MGRKPTYKPSTCPWEAMASRGLIPRSMAYHYRNGTGIPGPGRIAMLEALGYRVFIDRTFDRAFAECEEWPEQGES